MAKESSADINPATINPALAAGLGNEQVEAWSSQSAPALVSFDEEEDEGPDPLIGRVLSGLYRITGRIGEGGMGTGYNAVHVHLNKSFAVKVLAERIAQHKSAVGGRRRFRRRASARCAFARRTSKSLPVPLEPAPQEASRRVVTQNADKRGPCHRRRRPPVYAGEPRNAPLMSMAPRRSRAQCWGGRG